jgi:hypothetical protein
MRPPCLPLGIMVPGRKVDKGGQVSYVGRWQAVTGTGGGSQGVSRECLCKCPCGAAITCKALYPCG